MNIYRVINWKEPVRKVRYFSSKGGVHQYKLEVEQRTLDPEDIEVEEIPLDYKYQILVAINEAVGYGELGVAHGRKL
jgi:hypothetical protein